MIKHRGKLGLLLVTVLVFLLIITGCKQISDTLEAVSEDPPAADTNTPTATVDLEATAEAEKALEEQKAQTVEAEVKMTVDAIASATAEEEAAQAELANQKATEEAEAAATEQAKLDATATELAKPTNTPTNTPLPPPTNTPAAAAPPAASDRIVRAPGEKAAGDHPVNIKNKTGANVTLYMDGDPFKYQFNVPDGNHKIYLRPGFFYYTVYLCGGKFSGSHQFNANWTWTLTCP